MHLLKQILYRAAPLAALLLAACAGPTIDSTYECGVTVGTLAGSGLQGSANGTGSSATFNQPTQVAIGGGYLYVTEFHAIRKVEIATGLVATLAGSATAGYAEGTGAAAAFNYPTGIATDGTNLYVADRLNHRIRKVVIATGQVTTLAGSGVDGSADGTGTSASFSDPGAIATDGSRLYVAESIGSRIRQIVIATGKVTTLAGSGAIENDSKDGTGTQATFLVPSGIVVVGDNLFVAESHKIRKVVIATGEVTTLAGSTSLNATDGTGGDASFAGLSGIATDGTNLYVTDTYNNSTKNVYINLLRKVVIATGVVSTLAGSNATGSTNGDGKNARFSRPYGIVSDTPNTDGVNLYVADFANNMIREIHYKPNTCTSGPYSIGGSVSGLHGTLKLQLSSGTTTIGTISKDTSDASSEFVFTSSLDQGSPYLVTILSKPDGQICSVTNGSGTASAKVSNITVSCMDNAAHTIGGTLSGLTGGTLTLRNNNGDDLSLSADGPFTFATSIATGGAYAVTVFPPAPAGQTCSVTNDSGIANSDVTNVVVNCVASGGGGGTTYTIGGVVNGLNAVTLELQNNGGDTLQVFPGMPGASIPFTFATPVAAGGGYSATVLTNPAGQTCTVASGSSGTANANVSDVVINCI